MATGRRLIAKTRKLDLLMLDGVVAVGLTVAAIADAASTVPRAFGVPTIVVCVACTGSVAWRRRAPVVMAVLAGGGYVALVAVSGYDGAGTYEFAAVGLTSYSLGRSADDRRSMIIAALLAACWMAGCVAIFYIPSGGSVGVVLSLWFVAVVAFAVGRSLVTRSALTRELESRTARLADEQDLRARRAVAEERNRMARELHDVIAHCMSVMVAQTSAARTVAPDDRAAACRALGVVEVAGRDALVELRRMVGVLRRGSGQLEGVSGVGLSQLGALVERARAAGLPVTLEIDECRPAVSPGVDLVAYRAVQEALTNVVKHAGPASAHVIIRFEGDVLDLSVCDTGQGPLPAAGQTGPGHGLLGMSERVALYGGALNAGPGRSGGFEVHARIPLDASTAPPERGLAPRQNDSVTAPPADRLRWPWLDPVLAVAVLVELEIAVMTSGSPRGSLILNMIVVAVIALVTAWRRRQPVLFCVTIWVLSWVMSHALTPLNSSALPKGFLFVAPLYTLAAWTGRRTAVAGLAFVLLSAVFNYLFGPPGYNITDYASVVFVFLASWAVGRAFRARRLLVAELERTSARLAAEQEDRERLSIAGERSRIARELHSLVARSVAAMVVQTEAAQSLLDGDLDRADAAMDAIERTGREALGEMRRILGVLRHGPDADQRAPQPGVDQIYTLIQRAREHGQPVELSVDGDPGTLPAGVELGLYRILEEALQTARKDHESPVKVTFSFGQDDQVELRLASRCARPSHWPSSAMLERVAWCGGRLNLDGDDNGGWRLVARMPRGAQGVPA